MFDPVEPPEYRRRPRERSNVPHPPKIESAAAGPLLASRQKGRFCTGRFNGPVLFGGKKVVAARSSPEAAKSRLRFRQLLRPGNRTGALTSMQPASAQARPTYPDSMGALRPPEFRPAEGTSLKGTRAHKRSTTRTRLTFRFISKPAAQLVVSSSAPKSRVDSTVHVMDVEQLCVEVGLGRLVRVDPGDRRTGRRRTFRPGMRRPFRSPEAEPGPSTSAEARREGRFAGLGSLQGKRRSGGLVGRFRAMRWEMASGVACCWRCALETLTVFT